MTHERSTKKGVNEHMKAKTTTSKRPSSLFDVLPSVTFVCILSIVSYVSQIILHPVYGSVGTALHHSNVVFTLSTLTSLVTFLGYGERLPSHNWKPLALLLISAPLILPTLFRFSVNWGPVWGPILTQSVMTWPCVFFASQDISKRVVSTIGKQEFQRSLSLPLFLALSIGTPLTVILHFSEQQLYIPYFQPFIGVAWSRFSTLLFLGVIAFLIDNTPTIKRRDWSTLAFTIATLIPIVLLILNRPHVITGVNSRLLARLPQEYTYLDRRESITGMITVVENSESGYRVLKCDHSLLGGLWTGIKRKELAAQGVTGQNLDRRSVDEAESVYTAFLVQEAVRLVQRPRKNDSALIMYSPINCH